MAEIYISVDIETDGPIPGPNSMLSFGAAAFLEDGTLVDTYEANLELLPNAEPDLDTMKWWRTQLKAWEACRKNKREPSGVMPEFVEWVESLKDKVNDKKTRPVFVGAPAGFDFNFMYWYMIRFANYSPFSFSALDVKTFAMATLGCDYRKATKRNFPKRWFGKKRHTHVAIDDAIEQGEMFINILRESRHGKS